MDTNRFDRAIRSLHDGAPRRQVLGMLLGGALGIAGLNGHEATAGKKGKKISMCLNGTTVTVKKSKKGQLLGQGATVGACPPKPTCPSTQKLCNDKCIDKASCCTDTDCDKCKQQTCQNNACACKTGTVADANGFCGAPPVCKPVGAQAGVAAECCSGIGQPQLGFVICVPGPGQGQCLNEADCVAACKGFMCPALYTATVGAGC